MEHGLLLGGGGMLKNVLKIKPPFIINQKEADIVLGVLTDALSAAKKN